jgi:protoheme IX farnesyltransferase
MNETTTPLSAAPLSASLVSDPAPEAVETSSLFADLMELTKARLSTLVLMTTFVGFALASGSHLDWVRLLHTLLGTGLVAGAAAVLNQAIEADIDRLMERTRQRPLPARRISRGAAVAIGVLMAVAGLADLALATTFVATYLAAATLLIYLAIYTPMKRRSSLCVSIGAVSGAIPPVLGWTAVNGTVGLGAWVLFGILFTWQMPHFLAIAWMYRDQYAQAGFRMLRCSDTNGRVTAVQSLVFSLLLTAITLIPFFRQGAGWLYLVGTLLCNAVLLACAVGFLAARSRSAARWLFFASILYLPLVLGLMVFAVR